METRRKEGFRVIARMLRVEVGPDRIDAVAERYRELVRPIHLSVPGLRRHLVMADRDGGTLAFIGVWESPEALEHAAPDLEPAREQLWASFGETPGLERYEVLDEI